MENTAHRFPLPLIVSLLAATLLHAAALVLLPDLTLPQGTPASALRLQLQPVTRLASDTTTPDTATPDTTTPAEPAPVNHTDINHTNTDHTDARQPPGSPATTPQAVTSTNTAGTSKAKAKPLDLTLPADLPELRPERNDFFNPQLQQQRRQARNSRPPPRAARVEVWPPNAAEQQTIRVGEHCFEVQHADILDADSYQTWSFTDCPPR